MAGVRTHGGNVWALAKTLQRPVEQTLDFSADLNPLGFPDVVRTIIAESVAAICHYPDPEAVTLRQALAARHGVPIEWLWAGNGSAELIAWLSRVRAVRRAVVVTPTFCEYAWTAGQAGAEVVTLPLTEGSGYQLVLDEPAWRRALRGADLVFLGNPNNPTGTLAPLDALRRLAAWCGEHGAWLIVDEAFMEFVAPARQTSAIPELARWPHVIVLRSLTKCFAIPGLRLGYAVAAPAIIERLRAAQPAWPLNTFALAVGPALVGETAFLERTRDFVRRQREALVAALAELPGVSPVPSAVNFVLCRLAAPQPPSEVLREHLAARGVLIRAGDGFDGLAPGRCVRLAVRGPQDQHRLIHAWRAALEHLVSGRHAG